MTIVLCSKGYPKKYKNNKPIKNIEKLILSKNDFIYHAGTKFSNNQLFSNGGRVLNSTVSLKDLKSSRDRALELLDELDWENKYYRRDIGWRAI